jgi:TOMM system kinase/cyclase fusion protein
MTFEEILAQVREQLQREGRVAYRILKRRFDLSDDDLEDLKADLIDAKQVAVDEEGKVLVWTGGATEGEKAKRGKGEKEVVSSQFSVFSPQHPTPNTQHPAERRQLTVMFCDLVGSTALSERLDPEELREVIRTYQETCTRVIGRFEGHVAQYLGDGLLAYFGYPAAHEDDAQRAVRAGLEIIEVLQSRARQQAANTPLPHGRGSDSLQVRIGIHTGLVVVGEMGGGEKREQLALGDTPNIAARLQGLAEPDSVVVSAATQRLVAGLFECQNLGSQTLKGISTPMAVYRVVGEGAAQSRFEVAIGRGLTPLVGREEELALLRRRWEQTKEGAGQVVLLSGEPGIGKSRLVQTLKEQVIAEGASRIEFRCSPYHQNSALYPIIDHLQKLLQFTRDDSPEDKLKKLEAARVGAQHAAPLPPDTIQLLAALLSLPHPEGSPPITVSPQKQKEKTQAALVAWVVEEAEKAPVYCAWEDLHWADPSTLELLTLYLEQIPTTRIFTVLTFRPDFTPPWSPRSYLTQLTLSRLGRQQVEVMVEQVTGGKELPKEIVQQIVSKTDGVPLFVEELTKMVVESDFDVGARHAVPLQALGIPATLQDALMARLDRLAPVKEIAQVGATLGREFSYELIHAVSSLDEAMLQQGLRQLVEAELVYQRGLLPQATYLFKHALIQDAAYQSLLKSTRQQYHQQIAQVLEERFTNTKETHPELLAHHYTEASLIKQAVPYWLKAGQKASQRSANIEAIAHLTKGLELLKALPDTPERAQQELTLQIALGPPLVATKSFAAPEVKQVYSRALELCRQVGETPQLLPVLKGLHAFYVAGAEYRTAHELAEQLFTLAQRLQDPALLIVAHAGLGVCLWLLGDSVLAREHFERGIALYDPQQHRSLVFLYGQDLGVYCHGVGAFVLWCLGYPTQALKRAREALTLAHKLSHPYTLAYDLFHAAMFYQFRREGKAVQELAEEAITLSTEQGFHLILAWVTIFRGWALAEQGEVEEGIAQMRQSLAAFRATGAGVGLPLYLSLLAKACGKVGQAEEGLTVLAEALNLVHKTGECCFEAELYRLKGELLLTQVGLRLQAEGFREKTEEEGSRLQAEGFREKTEEEGSRLQAEGFREKTEEEGSRPQAEGFREKTEEAEKCFHTAIAIAQKQQAKSLELRATVSLARLWQQQGKQYAARNTLSAIYNWFTEGFDTKDLQEAKALLEGLSH